MTRFGRYDSTSSQTEIASWDRVAGAPSGYTRHYASMGDNWNGAFTRYSYANNRIPCISPHARDQKNNALRWTDIANGRYDDDYLSAAGGLKALSGRNVPAYLIFHHEPENELDGKTGSTDIIGTCGTQQDFKDAAEHFRALIRTVLTYDDAVFGVTFMAGSYRSGRWKDWVPDRYQLLGVDGYSHGSVNKQGVPTETFANVIGPAHEAALSVSRKFFIQETGCAEVPAHPEFKAQYFTDAAAEIKTWPDCIGVEYSNVKAKGDYRINTSPQALAAYQAWAQDPAYQGDWT